MKRRRFLWQLAGAAVHATVSAASTGQPVRVHVDPTQTLRVIPPDFIGLGYEISSVATPGLLSAKNTRYVQLVRRLGPHGVIRIGGNTSDYSAFSKEASPVASPKSTVINERNLQDLGSFLDATGWDLIWGLNLGRGSEQDVVEEARAVMAHAKSKLLAFEIGNEPDLFAKVHRPQSYPYADFLREYRRMKTALRRQLPKAPFAGPDVASATDWVTRFAADEGTDLKLLTHHYYRECAKPTSTFEKLLRPDPKLMPMLTKLRDAAASSGVPYRICETNSFCGGGKPGVSDTFCSALWALDFMFTLASAGAGGLNMETGVNQLDFISSYSPIGDNQQGVYTAKPEYYGMLAFAQAGRGRMVRVDCEAANLNLTAYAAVDDRKRLALTAINKEVSQNATLNLSVGGRFTQGTVSRLTGPSLDSKEGITLGGSSVTMVRMKDGHVAIDVPAASALTVTFEGHA